MRASLVRWGSSLLLLILTVVLFRGGSLRSAHARDLDVLAQAELHNLLAQPVAGMLQAELSPEIQRFYLLSAYSLAWTQQGVPTPQAVAVCDQLKNAQEKGLSSEDYDAAGICEHLAEFSREGVTSGQLAKFDIEFTTTVIHFATDLSVGRIDPRQLQFALDSERKKIQISDFLISRLIHASNVPAAIAELEPRFAGYHRTEAALTKYLAMAKAGEDPSLPIPRKSIKVGDPYVGTQQLAQRLIRLGDLSDSPAGQAPVYSAPLAGGVRQFQQRHGLDASGVLDRATVIELNRPLSHRVLQLELTLERWRWLPSAFAQPPIVVNIPEFSLRAYDENHHAALVMPVIVGKAFENQTPVFQDNLESVIFRPCWNVPLSIVRTEVIPEIQKDAEYLSKQNFEITTKEGTLVSADIVSESMLRRLHSGELEIRQRPGPQNALGLIKFEFPNQYYVYLHGTPAQELFRRPRRDFSHGCIRVEDPVALAAWVLRSDPSWNIDRVREAMTGNDSLEVKLPKPIPVLILYGTAVVEENGEVHFFRDIYGHDRALMQAIEDHSKRDQGL